MRGSVDMNFLFTLGEVQRMMRAYADRQAARYGSTRAQSTRCSFAPPPQRSSS